MRTRFWTFAALVALALVANLALVSARFAQTIEEGLGSRLTVASGGLRTQIELLDLRISPRIAAFNPELIEATKPAGEASQQPSRPDERALRAAAAALQPEPDLVVVATAHAAAVSRRGRSASLSEDPSRLPMIRIALEGGGASPQFVTEGGKLYRAAAARIPGNAAVVLTGTLIDDRFAAQLRGLVDADVTFLQQGAAAGSSLPADDRAKVVAWAKAAAGAGFGALRIDLPLVGTRFSEQLPLGAPRAATRAALVQLGQGVQAVVSVPAAPHLSWLARYQAFYAAGWALFVLVSFIGGLFAGGAPRAAAPGRPAPAPSRARVRKEAAEVPAAPVAAEAPWSDETVSAPAPAAAGGHEPLDPELPIAARDDEPQFGQLSASEGADPMWSGDPFSALAGAEAKRPVSPAGSLELTTEPPAADATQGEEQPGTPPSDLGAGWSDAPAADTAAAPAAWGSADAGAAEPWPPPEPQAPGTAEDPDEAHFRETFEKFMALRAETGESGTLTYEKFAAKLRKNREQMLSRGTARKVRFTVYKKDGRAAIKASALR
jgi:hypothetical protein